MAGYRSPHDAAMTGFPTQHCRVIDARIEGNDAYVLLDTGSPGQPYLYGVCCFFRDGAWHEGISGNGPGWSATDADHGLGTWALWDDASAGADMVRVEFHEKAFEYPIRDGFYLAVWFRQPAEVIPRVTAVRVGGRWASLE